jgi:hypothetical protein
MELADGQRSLLEEYLGQFGPLIGDGRTGRLFRATVQGIIGAETLVAARIAAFSPVAAELASEGCREENGEWDGAAGSA